MMSKYFQIAGFLILACFLGPGLTACSVSSPPVEYYSLLGTTTRGPADRPNNHLIVSIGPVTLPETLKNSQIVTGGDDSVFHRSEYHRWSGEVDLDFARALAEQLAYDLGTERIIVFPGNGQIKPDCQVLIDILAMDGDLGKKAELTVRWTLIDRKGKNGPVFMRSHFSERPTDAGYTAWVISQRNNLHRLGEDIAAKIKDSFKID
jgi:uncharacterized protein